MVDIKCPKCESSALSSTSTNIPSESRNYVKLKCLNCGAQFELADVKKQEETNEQETQEETNELEDTKEIEDIAE